MLMRYITIATILPAGATLDDARCAMLSSRRLATNADAAMILCFLLRRRFARMPFLPLLFALMPALAAMRCYGVAASQNVE